MDPNANIEEQRSLAREIIRTEEGDSVNGLRLAELVVALDEWRKDGGFDPYLDRDQLNEIADRYVAAASGDSNDSEIDVRGEFVVALGGGPFIDAADARAEAANEADDGIVNEPSPDPDWMNP